MQSDYPEIFAGQLGFVETEQIRQVGKVASLPLIPCKMDQLLCHSGGKDEMLVSERLLAHEGASRET